MWNLKFAHAYGVHRDGFDGEVKTSLLGRSMVSIAANNVGEGSK